MEPTVRIEGPETETEAVEEPLPLKNCSMLSIVGRADSRWDGARVLEGT